MDCLSRACLGKVSRFKEANENTPSAIVSLRSGTDQDPYWSHCYRTSLDGGGEETPLTPVRRKRSLFSGVFSFATERHTITCQDRLGTNMHMYTKENSTTTKTTHRVFCFVLFCFVLFCFVLFWQAEGTHTVQLSPQGTYLIDTCSSATSPPVVTLRDASNGEEILPLDAVTMQKKETPFLTAQSSHVGKLNEQENYHLPRHARDRHEETILKRLPFFLNAGGYCPAFGGGLEATDSDCCQG
jgi:hypothetical protein